MFTTQESHTPNAYWSPSTWNPCNNDIKTITAPFTHDEIKNAMFDFKPYKAPSPDGLHPYFFQKYWPAVRNKVIRFCKDILCAKSIPEELNKTLVCLIPKSKHPSTVTQFRPISLCNTLYKLITKLIFTRLKPIVNKIIGPTQTSFQQGKMASHNAIIVQEALNYLAKMKCKSSAMILKLDLEKAFNRLE